MGKRSILFVGILGVAFGCGFLGWWLHQTEAAQPLPEIALADESQRQAFLAAQGQSDFCLVATQTVRIPVDIDAAYAEYASMQQAQGLPLSAHLGETATRYSYAAADDETDCAELLLNGAGVLLGAMRYDSSASEEPKALRCD